MSVHHKQFVQIVSFNICAVKAEFQNIIRAVRSGFSWYLKLKKEEQLPSDSIVSAVLSVYLLHCFAGRKPKAWDKKAGIQLKLYFNELLLTDLRSQVSSRLNLASPRRLTKTATKTYT